MPEIMLAETGGRIWLVTGDEHVGDLLAGTLPTAVTVAFRPCATPAEVLALWHATSPAADAHTQPWLINPLIADRIRRSLSVGSLSMGSLSVGSLGVLQRRVQFPAWSALIDPAALAVLDDAAQWLAESLAQSPGGHLVLRQFTPAEPVPGHPDLQRIRLQLARAALERRGATALRDDSAVADAEADADCLDIVTVVADAAGHGGPPRPL